MFSLDKLLHYETGGLVIYAKMLDRGTFAMPLPRKEKEVTRNIMWEDLRKMVEGIMANPDSRQVRLDGLKIYGKTERKALIRLHISLIFSNFTLRKRE